MPPPRPLAWLFPMPDTPLLQVAYRDLYLAAEGTPQQRRNVGDPSTLPKPWDPPTCTDPLLRQDVWDWLEEVVVWFNHDYVWDPNAGTIPACWPHHPHLVHEIAVLADQRRRAGIATTSDQLEDWHRYTLPAFLERMRTRVKNGCDDTHTPWPARGRHNRHTQPDHHDDRARTYGADVTHLTNQNATQLQQTVRRPALHIVEPDGHEYDINPDTGELT